MNFRELAVVLFGVLLAAGLLVAALFVFSGFGNRPTRVEAAVETQTLHLSNGTEPEDLDPHLVTGVPERNIIDALIEGLTTENPETLAPEPGVAESWDVSGDGLVYTFHLRPESRWTTGDPVTAHDFVASFKRNLSPVLASQYSYMLFAMKNAEAYNTGELTDFSEVGCKALDDHTLEITLVNPTPYFPSLVNHYSWFPVHVPTLEKHGPVEARGNTWTRVGNFVGNGPFVLKEWVLGDHLTVEKNPDYWDAENIFLNRIVFYGIENADTDERSFRAGQTHNIYTMPQSKIQTYQEEHPDVFRLEPYAGTYFYRINVTKPPLDNVLVRKALTMAIDRESLVRNVTRGGQIPGNSFTPPNIGGYTPTARVEDDFEEARRLLAEAGYPNGEGFPKVEILYNTSESHRNIAQAIQEMWRTGLNIDITLVNQEWKVYLASQRALDYQISRAGWIGDYVDPNSFLDMWTSWSQQNQTGWKNAEYDRLIELAATQSDEEERLETFQQAEAILLDELPVIPIYIYTRVYALHPGVRGWYANILDHHPYKGMKIVPADQPEIE